MRRHPHSRWWGSLFIQSLDYSLITAVDVEDSVLGALAEELISSGFRPYLTSVGGSGLGILSPYDPANYTPGSPSTPGTLGQQPLLRETLEAQGIEELTEWAEKRGRWLYV
jgi:hypothetical protein